MFVLVDCNNFYVSCERVFRPGLYGKPVVILSNNDGCIIARSEEAKALGLKMAEPVFKRTSFIWKNKVHIFSSNYTLYGDLSQRVMETLKTEAPAIEIYSIDEAFLKLDGTPDELEIWASNLKKKVWNNTGIPVSVGVATTKTLAKIASKAAKQGNGIFVIRNERHRDCLIRNTAVEKVWGIGRQYHKLLYKNNLFTAFDFAKADDQWLRAKMKVMGLRIKKELLGESCVLLEETLPPKKAIATTRAFGKKTKELQLIQEAVSTYASRCGEKLRRQKSVANILTVFIHTDPFNPYEPQYNKSKSVTLPVATSSTSELIRIALILLEEIYDNRYLYKKAGVIVEGLEPEKYRQYNLFEATDRQRQDQLFKTIDRLNTELGSDKIKLAIQGDGKKWKLRQENLSQRYTTCWDEILAVKV